MTAPYDPLTGPELTQKELAERFGLVTRQIHNLTREGMPSVVRGGKRWYPWLPCLRWYIARREEVALQRAGPKAPADQAEAETRKAIADAEIAELKLAKLRGEVVPIEEYRRELRRICDRLRAAVLGMPGMHAHRAIGLPDMPHATRALREIAIELLTVLRAAGTADSDPGPEEDAA